MSDKPANDPRGAVAVLGEVDLAGGSVRLQRDVPGAPREVWAALTTPRGTSAWLGRLIGAPSRAHDTFEIDHGEGVVSRHAVQRWEPPERVTMTWDFPHEATSTVTFVLGQREAATTVVALHHVGLADPLSYAAGWHRHLHYLAAHLAGRDEPADRFWDGYDELVETYRRSAR